MLDHPSAAPDGKDLFAYERTLLAQGARLIAGIDEAGRGPLAGPVVAAAVVLPEGFRHDTLNDSKKLSPEVRENLFVELTVREDIVWAVGVVDHEEIDQINILQATHRAMKAAVDSLHCRPDFLLIDGLPVPVFSRLRQLAVIQGDGKSFSIAAASVIAKVTRDRIMIRHHRSWPDYRFDRHKGYATPEHLEALQRFGPCPIHRKSFFPIRRESAREDSLFHD